MTDSVNVFPPFWRFLDANGDPVAGGYLEFYIAGSSTPLSVYSDAGLTSALGTTVYCDSGGHPVASSGSSTKVTIWTGTTDYKVVGKTSTGTTLGTLDNFPGALDTSSYATTSARPVGNVVAKAATSWSASTSDGSGTLYNANVAGGSQIGTLPSAVTAGNGYILGIRHDGQGSSNTVTYQTVSSQAIKEGHLSAPVTAGALTAYGETVWLISDGAGWTVSAHVPALTRKGEALVVVSRLTSAPTSPAAGACHLISGTPTGTWLAQGLAEGDLVQASGIGTWTELAVSDGMMVYVAAEALNYQRQGATWVPWTSVSAPDVSYLRRLSVEETQAQNTAGGATTANTWHDRTLNTTIVNTLTTANGAATDAALATNIMTVPAGTYDVMFGAPVYGNYYTRTRLISATEADSATSFAVGTGSKAFTVLSGLAFAAGQEVYIYSSGTPTRIMEGSVVSYSGTTLTVSVSRTSGTGTSTDWKIAIVLYGQNGGAGQTGVTNALHMSICRRSITLAAAHGFKLQSLTDTAVATFGLGSPANRPGQAERYGFCEWLDLSSLMGPRGDQGPQGNDGADGAAGAAGATGATGATGAAAPAFIDYSLDPSSTADSDPGSGKLRPNHATAASVTTFYVDDVDRLGNSQAAELPTWDDSTSTGVKGKLYIIDLTTPANRWTYDVTAYTAATGYSKLSVTHRSGSAAWPTGNVGLLFVPRGDAGSGNISGGVGSIDNRLPRSDGTGGVTLQASGITVDDSNNVSGIGNITLSGTVDGRDVSADGSKLDYITVTQAVDLDAIETRVAELDASVILKGNWDASAGTFPGSGVAQAGWSYIVSVAGTVNSIPFSVNDRVIAIADNASTSTYAANWIKADYTDQVLSVAGKTGAVTLASGDLTDVSAFAETLLDDADAAAARATLVAEPQGSVYGFNDQTGTTYTLVLTDKGKRVTMSNASSNTLTVPPNASVAFAVGDRIELFQGAAGQTTVAAGSGVTINSSGSKLKLTGQYSGAVLTKTATNTWDLIGDIAS